VSSGVWHLVQVSFGDGRPLQISIDGEVATPAAPRTVSFVVCGQDTPNGIDGNDQPWVLGALMAESSSGSTSPAQASMGGATGSLRINRVRRDR